MSPQPLKAPFGCDTEAALAVVDQKTGLSRSVGWICHRRNPPQSPIHRINTQPSRLRENSVYPQCTIGILRRSLVSK